jgi:serine phosphatase RsbU (regulator of sigma subunit)
MLKLVGTDGRRLYSWELEPGSYSVGRNPDSNFFINDKTVSREHARFEVLDQEKCRVTDLGSRNGTVVNGRRIEKAADLKIGDLVMFGQVEFKVSTGEPGASATTRPKSLLLSDRDPEKSVFLSINEALKPLPSKVTDLPDVLPTIFELAKILVLPEPKEEMLNRALKLVSRVIPAQRLAVLTMDEQGEVVPSAYLLPGGKDPGSFNLSQTIVEEILNEKNSILIDPLEDPRFAGHESIIASDINSAMAVPLFDEGVVLGILYADTTNPIKRYNDDYLRLLATFGNLIASRLLNYELMRDREEKHVFEAELKRASTIQRNLLVKSTPTISGFTVHAFQEQCRMVGGDLYDVTVLPDGKLLFMVADVSGKGMGGALLMSNILASFRILYSEDNFSLSRAVKQVSLQLFRYSAPEDFATLFIGLVDPADSSLTFINAGHNPPLLVHPDGKFEYMQPGGTMIGAFDFSDWEEGKIIMNTGDLLLVFTDGVVEADCHGAQYGDDRLENILVANRSMPPVNQIEKIMDDVITFVEDSPRSDDITMLMLKKG